MSLRLYIKLANQVLDNLITLEDAEVILDDEYDDWYNNFFLPYYESKESTRLWAIELQRIQGIINGVYQNLLKESEDIISTTQDFYTDEFVNIMSGVDKFLSLSYEDLSRLSEMARGVYNKIIEKSERFNAIKDTIAKQQLNIYGSAKIANAETIFKRGDIAINSIKKFCLMFINLINMQQESMIKDPNE